MTSEEILDWARHQHQQGQLVEAQGGYRKVLAQEPQNFVALHLLGVALHQQGCHDDALAWINKALAVRPESSEAWANHGIVCLARGAPDVALASFDCSLRVAPDCADTISGRADALSSLGRFDEAIREYDRALGLDASHIISWNNRGNSLQQAGQFEEAIESFKKALALNRQFVEAWNNFGIVLRRLGRLEEALMCHAHAIGANPNRADSWNRQAAVMLDLHRYRDALQSSARALTLSPAYADAFLNEGLGWLGIGKASEALVRFEKALSLEPQLPEASYLCGVALQQLGRHDESIPALEQALLKDRHHKFALGMLASAALQLCDWELATGLKEKLQDIGNQPAVIPPLVMLGYFDEPALLQQAARIGCPAPKQDVGGTFSSSHRSKIRVAYLSGDFCEHATAYLTAGLFESHDRLRFEILGVSHGPDDGSAVRRRLVEAFDSFIDVSERSDRDVARGLRELDVDILVDLKGHTRDARTAILAFRPAPVQVNFLGYPGTMGAPYIDYIIGDATVLPHDEQLWYDEAIVHLPYCYQPQDSAFTAGTQPSRESLGLPQNAFVFCCFNNHWKLTEPVFAIWVDLLKSVEVSVLWLLVGSASARERIRRYTAGKGVDPARVIFADRVSHDEHLARHFAADLFLDTWPYGAHTTASDALRSHLPVITTNGRAFQGRVAASLLRTLNLEELICQSADEYRATAIQLALKPTELCRVRETLRANLSNGRLFNAPSYCRYLEAAFEHMHKVRREGRKAEPFAVAYEHSIRVQRNNVDI